MSQSIPRCSVHIGCWSYGRDLCLECEAQAEADKTVDQGAIYQMSQSKQCANSTKEVKCPNPPRLGHIFCESCRVSHGGYPLNPIIRTTPGATAS